MLNLKVIRDKLQFTRGQPLIIANSMFVLALTTIDTKRKHLPDTQFMNPLL
jgi:hypothetical protein